jgi:general secretion pathway protein C
LQANWLSNSSDVSGRITSVLVDTLRGLAQPARARRLRRALLLVCVLWAVLGLSSLIWALLPAEEVSLPDAVTVINPLSEPATSGGARVLDIERMMAWHLFGEAGAVASTPVVEQAAPAPTAREGIEKGARETRLDLKLRGVVASSEDGLGHAIIEHKSKQAVYAVEDKLPLSGQVVLAKVMPRQVVLDNGGTYELLQLFEDSKLDSQLVSPPVRAVSPAAGDVTVVDKRRDTNASALAQSYRERLYQNPQSLAEVVTISAVRENGDLLGYRIAPGKDQQQFKTLGFKPGDLVTGVNGIALNDPANTVRLYQTMRSASEAVFDIQRNEQQLTINVSLGSDPGQGR